TAEDPCVRIEHHAAVNETVLYGMGEFHVRVLLERMSERYGVQVKTHPPSIPYRETVTRPAEGHCRHKKQTGGAGQFGEVYMRLEITAPASAIGDITGDLATKRARINGNNSLPGQRATLQALVPLAEVSEYQSRLKALTGGQGAYTMELSHYDPVPPRKQQEL